MVGAGMLMIFASMIGLYLSFRKKLETNKWFLRFMVGMIAFPFIANSAGWIMTEIGRQPDRLWYDDDSSIDFTERIVWHAVILSH